MITATLLAIFLVPAFFVAVLGLVHSRQQHTERTSGMNPQVAGE
jgi:hypothetical protein